MSEVDTNQIPSPLAGISTPPPTPNPDALSGSQADRLSSAAQTVQQNPTQQPTAPAQPPAPAPNKHEILGRLVSHLKNAVEGQQTIYEPDPNTGTVQEKTVPRKAGGLFRDILTGALAGMAASSMAPPRGGAAGFAIGAEGARELFQNRNDRSRQQAQNNATSGFQKKQQLDQQTLQAATVAHDMVNSLQIGHFIGHHNDTEISDYNNSASTVKTVLMDNGGQLADVEGNGKVGNGPALMNAYNRDNSLMAAPEGYHRVASITYDTDGLQHDKDTHKWVNEDGSQLSDDEWNKRGTVSLIDVPNAIWGKSVSLPGSVIQNIAPASQLVKDRKKSYSTSVGSLFALGLTNKQKMIDNRTELYRVPKDANELSQWDQKRQDIQGRMQSDPDSVTDDEKRFVAVKGPMVDRAKQQQAAAPVTVNDFKDAQNMLNSDNPKEASAAQDFFVTSLAGANGDKIAAFIQANPRKFTPDQVKTADSWVRKFGGIKGIEKSGGQASFGGSGKSGPDYIKTLPPGLQSQVKAFGEGRLDLSATPRGKEKTALIQTLTQAYPDFDQTKGQTWGKTRNEYMGAGQTAKKVVSYNTSLEHMQDLYDHSTFAGLYVPGSKDYSDRSVALHYVSNEVGTAIKTGVMGVEEGKEILDSLKGWTPGTAKERTAETARLLHDKIDEYQRKFQEATPSQSIQAPILMSPKAARAYDHTQGMATAQPTPPSGATMKVPGSDGQLHWSDGKQDLGVVQ